MTIRSILTRLAALALLGLAAPLAAQPYAYVPNSSNNTVSVINAAAPPNPAADTVVATIAGVNCATAVAVHPASQRAYVTNYCNDRLEVIDTASNTLLAPLAINGADPYAVAVNAAGTRAYVVNYYDGGANTNGELVILDLATGSVLAEVPVGAAPFGGVAVHPNGGTVYVSSQCVNNGSCGSASFVSAISTSAPYTRTDRTAGIYPLGVDISPDGSRVFVASFYNPLNTSQGLLSVLDTATLTISHVPTSGQYAYDVAVHPGNGRVYVSNNGSNSVSVFNADLTPLTTVAVGFSPYGVDVHPDGSRVYVANYSSGSVSVINAGTQAVSATVPVGSGPFAFGRFLQGPVGPTTADISGTVTTSLGVAMSGVTVAGVGFSTTTDGSGNFLFNNFNAGSYTFAPSVYNYTFAPTSRTVNLAGSDATGQDFVGTYNAIPDTTILRDGVVAANLTDTRLRNSLLAPLNAALSWLNGSDPNRVVNACSNLAKFISVVRQNVGAGKLSAAAGNAWVLAANDILALSGCPTR